MVRFAQEAAGVQQPSGNPGALVYNQLSTGNQIDLTGLAWVGRTVFASQMEGAASIEIGDRDYLIPAEDLQVGGVQFEPNRGDQLAETLEGTTEVYEIVSPNTGEPAWRWSDPQHTIFRVHTKQVA